MVDPVGFHAVGRARAATDPAVSQPSPKATASVAASAEFKAAPSLPKLVGMAQELAKAGPPIDYAKIAQIRQAIAQGTYEIDPSAIASAMLAYGRAQSA